MAVKTKNPKAKKKTPTKSEPARKLQAPTYKSFRLSRRIKPTHKGIPKARQLFSASLRHLWKYKRVFLGITGLYLLCSILLVKGLASTSDIPEIKSSLQEVLTGATGQLAASVAVFGYLVGNTSGVSSEVAGTYQSMLLIIFSLAIIWALRQTHAGNKIGVRESFYRGMYPLIPFLAVLLVIGVQTIPLVIGSWLFSVTVVSGLAVTGAEQLLWTVLCFLLALLSIYLISSSVFALYVATLPDMTPMKALRSTRELVRHRRWEILRKVVFLPVILLLLSGLLVIPVILFLTPLAEWVFFVLSMALLAITHSYIYGLYRELL